MPTHKRGGVIYWCRHYLRHKQLTPKGAYQLRRAAEVFTRTMGWHPYKAITTEVLSDFVRKIEPKYSPRSVRNYRASVLTILTFAADFAGYKPRFVARHVRNVKIPKPMPRAWTVEEMERLVQAAAEMKGVLKHRPRVKKAHYFQALILAAFDTGLRRGDLFNLRKGDITSDGVVYIRQGKTGEVHLCQLSPRAFELVRTIPYDNPLHWTSSQGDYTNKWRELTGKAGIRHGSLQQIRRSAATAIYAVDPAAAKKFLGHSTHDMWKHYVDRTQTERPIAPQPIVIRIDLKGGDL